jgi:predicted dehydrogenase
MHTTSETRRGFFGSVGRLGAGAAAVAALGARVESARGFLANDTLTVACLGTGGRCRQLMGPLARVPGVRIAAVCDIYEKHRDEARALADPKAEAVADYRALLERKDIDAFLIASPDHWHVPMTIDACDAGKDVYVEKPLTHDLSEGRAVIEARDKSRRVVQVGMQQRSMTHIQQAYKLVKQGRIGRVFKVHMSWNRNIDAKRMRRVPEVDPKQVDWKAFLGRAPEQTFDPFRFRSWRWFWDFGGGLLTDLMVHWVDVAHWFLDVDHPLRATAVGDFIVGGGLWQTPDTIQCLMSYPDEVQMFFEGTFSNAHNAARIEFMGTDGTLYIDRGRYEVYPSQGKGRFEALVLGTNQQKGLDFYDEPDGELLHLTNWAACVRTRQVPNAPVEAGVGAAAAAHLGNRAYRSGKVAAWGEGSA